MEFGGPFDEHRDIVTWRTEKWRQRVKVGSVIEIQRVHQQVLGRYFARVIAMDEETPSQTELKRLLTVYPPNTQLVRIVLRVEPGLSKDDPEFVTWHGKADGWDLPRKD